MNENWINDVSYHLEMLCLRIQYRLSERDLSKADRIELQKKYQQFIGVCEFLYALKSDDLEDYLQKNEAFTLNLLNLSEEEL